MTKQTENEIKSESEKQKIKAVEHNLRLMHPAVAQAIARCGVTPDEIARQMHWTDGRSAFDRILTDTTSLWRTFTLNADLGEKRRSGHYVFMHYARHAIVLDTASAISDLSPRVLNPDHAGSRAHLAKMLHVIQSVSNDDGVERFMIGKASVQIKEAPHAHSAMVNRFGDKYRARGYRLMIGLCMLDGRRDSAAEAHVLQMESLFHTLLSGHAKYDRALSNAQSGALSKSSSTAYVTLYVAVLFA